jgi:hypothetical protein
LVGDLVERAAGNAQGHGGERGEDDAEHGHPPQRRIGPRFADELTALLGLDCQVGRGDVVAAGTA